MRNQVSTGDRARVLDAYAKIGKLIEPLATAIDRSGEFSDPLWQLLVEHDVFGLSFPESVGGAGASFSLYIDVVESLATAGGIAGFYPSTTVQTARMLLFHGTPTQIDRWVGPLVRGQACAAWAFTEAQTGSDPKQIATTATPDGDGGWLLNGEKAFISFAARADVAVVFAKLPGGRLGAFLARTDQPGWVPGRSLELLAFAGMGTASVHLDDVYVGADGVLGMEGNGFEILHAGETEAKIRAAATCVGVAQRALDEAARYARQRTHRGVAIGDRFPTIQSLLGDMAAGVDGARALVRHVAQCYESGEGDLPRLAASARIVAARTSREVTGAALQVCGAYGLTKELPVERLYREGKFFEVGQGVAEIQRVIVAKRVLSDPRYEH